MIQYFLTSTPEHLRIIGVDPERLPAAEQWRQMLVLDWAKPIEQRINLLLIWLSDDLPVGFAAADNIVFGEQANIHLHVTDPARRNQGIGVECVRRSVDILFDRLKLKRLFGEPNALNVPPNRTLQKAGFSYRKTYMTLPGNFSFRQVVTCWQMTR